MKILQINAVNGILSTGRTTSELSEQLVRHGHDSYIAYSEGDKYEGEGEQTYRIGRWWGKKLHGLLSRIFGLQGYFSTISTYALIHYIKSIEPDIIHLRNLHSNYIHIIRLLNYLGKAKIATVITLHDCWFYTGRCSHYTKNQCYQWKTGCKRCPNNDNNMPSWFFDRSKKMWLDKKKYFQKIEHLAVVGVSDWITKEAKASYLSQAKVIKRIYNWVDLEVFRPVDTKELRKQLGLEDKFVILGVAATWGNAKGLQRFLALSMKLPESYVILLVGEINEVGVLPKNIITKPQTNNLSELASYYAMSDVFVSLSREEAFGKVIAEALACGTPVVVYNSTASPELVGENCGYVAEHNRLYEIYEGINQIYRNKKDYYSLSCRQYAMDHFDLSQCTTAYIDVYETLLKERNDAVMVDNNNNGKV